ncbi:MAG: thioredoxin-dependent thiol peroxidase [Pseudomonadales bacterium]|nr:thioredoxin-dependent thiol peroxidase [Pseudomonadales bacterium]
MALPEIGKQAPAFSLPDQHGRIRGPQDYKGRVLVIYFYPKAMTPGCTVQACGIRDSRKRLEQLDVAVLGISTDPVARLAKFADKEKLNFTLLADEDHAVADHYGVWDLKKFMGREYMGIKRMSFIVGADGKLRHIMEKVNTKTHHQDVLAWIEANIELLK